MCTRKGLVNAGERIVVVQKVHEDLTLKIVSVDELGHGIKKIRHQSLQDLVVAAGYVGIGIWGMGCSQDGRGKGGRGCPAQLCPMCLVV